MPEFRMPALGADMDAGTLVEWKVRPGDAVRRGEVIAVVETQKGAIDVEIWQDGVIERLVAAPGTRVPVGEVLATLEGEAGLAPAVAPPPAVAPAVAAPAAAIVPRPADTVRASPAARRRAAELGVNLATVSAAQPGAPLSIADVERARTAASPRAPAAEWHTQMRAAIAAAMSRSKREIPHYYLAHEVDVTRLEAWLAEENLKRPVAERLLPAVPLMKAVALALRAVPELNGVWKEGEFRPSPAVHLGMAVAMRGGGLVAPAIHDADRKSLDELMADLRDLVTRVRGGRLRSSEMSDPTVTLSSLGDGGVDQVFGVIYPPQVAIVGAGSVAQRPWVVDGAVVPRRIMRITLSADHRASDGHRGAVFLATLAGLMQEPERLR